MNSSLTQFIVGVMTLGVAASGYAWWYNLVTVESASAQNLSEEITSTSDTARQTSAIETALAEIETSQGTVQGYFISESNVVVFLEELEKIGDRASSTVKVTSIGAPGAKATQTIPLLLTIDGSFDGVLRTLGAIENAPYAVSVSSVALSSIAEEKSTRWSANVTLSVGSVTTTLK